MRELAARVVAGEVADLVGHFGEHRAPGGRACGSAFGIVQLQGPAHQPAGPINLHAKPLTSAGLYALSYCMPQVKKLPTGSSQAYSQDLLMLCV